MTDPTTYSTRYYVGAGTWHEAYFVSSDSDDGRKRHNRFRWGDYAARKVRYEVYRAHFEGNVYREVHYFAGFLKDAYGVDHYTRSIFSPAHRIGEFWATHLLGGALDPSAGDGKDKPSGLPIEVPEAQRDGTATPDDLASAIRSAIARCWKFSNWQANKETWGRNGAVCGDAPLMVVDDESAQRVTFKVIDPATLADFQRDAYGNCRAYQIEEWRLDPDIEQDPNYPVYTLYIEICEKVGESIRYATFKGDRATPYDWREYDDATPNSRRVGSEWTEPYGFVPLVMVQHHDMGLGWGWSELHPVLSKLYELDDLASKLSDWIKIAVDAPWFFTGVKPQAAVDPDDPTCSTASSGNELVIMEAGRDGEGRARIPTLTSLDPASKSYPLIAPLPVDSVSIHILKVLDEIRNDRPELRADDVGPQSSGEARRVAMEKVEALVYQRRAGYDDAMVRANQMMMSIGAVKGYPGYEVFSPDSYDRGELDHSIGARPVFAVDKLAVIGEQKAMADAVKVLVDAGVPVDVAMGQVGYGDDVVKATTAGIAAKQQQAMDMLAAQRASLPAPGDGQQNGQPSSNINGRPLGSALIA